MVTDTLSEVKSRPLLFNEEMVRAFLAGKKTQTRRIIQRVRTFGKVTEFQRSQTPGYDWTFRCRRGLWQDLRTTQLQNLCPYGFAGERIYGRETLKQIPDGEPNPGHSPHVRTTNWCYVSDGIHLQMPVIWPSGFRIKQSIPSIHMPKWAARVWAQIVDVRIERLADISEADAYAEGVTVAENHQGSPDFDFRNDARVAYRQLWERINGPGSWSINPYVWVIEFKRLNVGIPSSGL